jgi:hypothetical protein
VQNVMFLDDERIIPLPRVLYKRREREYRTPYYHEQTSFAKYRDQLVQYCTQSVFNTPQTKGNDKSSTEISKRHDMLLSHKALDIYQ